MAAVLTARDQESLATLSLWLDSTRDWYAVMWEEESFKPSPDTPAWVRTCSARLDNTLFAPAKKALDQPVRTPFRAGYALGIIRWGTDRLIKVKIPREVREAAKKIRLSKKARKEFVRRWQAFLIDLQLFVRKNGRLQFAFRRELNWLKRTCDRYEGPDESEYHRGLADGLRGFGRGAPGDRSNLATDVYLFLVIWWRFVARFRSVTELHAWLQRCLGQNRAGDRKRTEKICERIELTFRGRGRPPKNPTLLLTA